MKLIISVIVPIYNAAPFLDKCIQSILNQSFEDFELLLINDGSKDNSGAICDGYAQKDKRVKVFHQANAGVSAARNKGLDNAQGEWVAFVDADDWVENDYLKNLYLSTTLNNSDFVISNIKSIYKSSRKNNKLFDISELKTKTSFTPDDFQLDNKFILENYPVAKLFKKKIIQSYGLCFNPELRMGEDFLFVLQYGLKSKFILFNNNFDYCYNRTNESSATLKYQPYLYSDLIKLKKNYFEIIENFKKINEEEKLFEYFKVASKSIFQEGNINNNKSFKERYIAIKSILNYSEIKEYRRNYRLKESSNGFFEFVRKLMMLNQAFILTVFFTVYFSIKKLKNA